MSFFWKMFASLSFIIIPIEVAYYSNKIGKELWKTKIDCNQRFDMNEYQQELAKKYNKR